MEIKTTVVIRPANGRWSEEVARETLHALGNLNGVEITYTGNRRSEDYGEEEEIILKGDKEDIYTLLEKFPVWAERWS